MKNSVLRLSKRKAEFIEPTECAPSHQAAPTGRDGFTKIKLDGYRAIAVKSKEKRMTMMTTAAIHEVWRSAVLRFARRSWIGSS